MKNTTILNEKIISEESLQRFFTQYNNPSDARKRMKELLRRAVEQELTSRQRECIRLYYFERKKVCEIAAMTGVRPTTVYKHLNKARTALKRCTIYL